MRKKKDIMKRRHIDMSQVSEEELNRVADTLNYYTKVADLTLGKPLMGDKEKNFYTVEDVMELLSMSKSSVYRRIEDGTLSYIKVGRRYYFHRGMLFNKLLSKVEKRQ